MERKLLIFDLDGTIADTLPSIAEAVNMCASHFGYSQRDKDFVMSAVGNGVGALLKKTMPEDAVNDEKIFALIKEYFDRCYEITQAKIDSCYDGMSEALHSFYEQGYILAVLSNKPDNLVKMIIKNLFSDGIISKSEGQTELPKKPDPTVPLMIAKELGVSPENTYFIGDSEVDVITGRNAGMNTVAVSWGFRAREVLENENPDFIFDTRNELLDFFTNLK